ncbi:MAG: CDP-alcohol phosphatidyltransferase family protein [Longispora sp.]|nr:CDP-alcohol phosphatidyltransferase family protein [Longispora sp. (in: high G+C Gram-positive bacteria)]
MPPVRLGPVIGLTIHIVLLALLAVTVGLDGVGWGIGILYGLIMCGILVRALNVSAVTDFGPANWVTLTRAVLVGCVTALIADSFARPAPVAVLVTIVTLALVLDMVDGQVARRTGTVSEFGARFDMEVDAFLILALSVYVAGSLGWWVLAIGAMRYAFVAARWVLPWMRGTAPPRFWCKIVAAVQGIVLVVAAAEILPRPLTVIAVSGALILLIESFGREIVWLWRQAPSGDS